LKEPVVKSALICGVTGQDGSYLAQFLLRKGYAVWGDYPCTGILFNHESPLRPERFVTRKIISAAKRIAAGSNAKLLLGRMDIARDWGWAPEYVEAMWLMLQPDQPEDFVIATGESHTLEEFVQTVFSAFDLDWQNHVEQDASLFRPSDVSVSAADPSKAKRCLGWNARARRMPQVVEKMIEQSPDSDLTCWIQH
jgi:GDPmannose 4,6-dehydratase